MLIFLFILFFLPFLEDMKVNLNSKEPKDVLKALEYFCIKPYPGAFENVLDLTQKENLEIKKSATKTLGFLNKEEAIPFLLKLANDSDSFVRAYSLLSLMKLNAKKNFEEFKGLINDSNTIVQITAKGAYTLFKADNYKKELKSYLFSKNIDEAYFAASSLCIIGDDESLKSTLDLSKNAMDEYRNISAMALIYAPYSKELLKKLMETLDLETYFYVKQSLINSILFHSLKDINYFAELLIEFKNKKLFLEKINIFEDFSSLPKILFSKISKNYENLGKIIEILDLIEGNNSLLYLREIAFDKNIPSEKRYLAIRSLGKKTDKKSIPKLRKFLKEKDPYLKSSSCFVLGLLKDYDSKKLIIDLLKDENSRVKQGCLAAIREMDLKEAIKDVELLTNDKDLQVKQMADQVLKKLKEDVMHQMESVK